MKLEPDVLWAHQEFKEGCFGDEGHEKCWIHYTPYLKDFIV